MILPTMILARGYQSEIDPHCNLQRTAEVESRSRLSRRNILAEVKKTYIFLFDAGENNRAGAVKKQAASRLRGLQIFRPDLAEEK